MFFAKSECTHFLSVRVNWCFGEGRGKYNVFLCMCDNGSGNIVCMITAGPSVPAIAVMQLMYHSVPRMRVLSGSSAGEPVFCYVFNEHKTQCWFHTAPSVRLVGPNSLNSTDCSFPLWSLLLIFTRNIYECHSQYIFWSE